MVKWMVVMRQWWHQNDKMKYNMKYAMFDASERLGASKRDNARDFLNIYLLFVDHASSHSQPSFVWSEQK